MLPFGIAASPTFFSLESYTKCLAVRMDSTYVYAVVWYEQEIATRKLKLIKFHNNNPTDQTITTKYQGLNF